MKIKVIIVTTILILGIIIGYFGLFGLDKFSPFKLTNICIAIFAISIIFSIILIIINLVYSLIKTKKSIPNDDKDDFLE